MSDIEDRRYTITYRDGRQSQVIDSVTDVDAAVAAMPEADQRVARVEYRNGGAYEVWSPRAWRLARNRNAIAS